jgi:hypothetical protein
MSKKRILTKFGGYESIKWNILVGFSGLRELKNEHSISIKSKEEIIISSIRKC